MMQHKMSTVTEKTISSDNNVSVFGFGSLESHGRWLKGLQKLEMPSSVETSDDNANSIAHIGRVLLCIHDRKAKFI